MARSFRAFFGCKLGHCSLGLIELGTCFRISPLIPNVSPTPWTTRTPIQGQPPEFSSAERRSTRGSGRATEKGRPLRRKDSDACSRAAPCSANQLFGRSGEVWRCIQQCRFAVREGKRAAEAGGGLTKDVLDSFAALGRFKRPSVRRIGVDLSVPPPAWQLFSVRSEAFPLFLSSDGAPIPGILRV